MCEKTELAVGLLRGWEAMALTRDPTMGYWGCDSGGKDSGTIRKLAELAGVKVTWHHQVTGIDPPEVIEFIQEEHPETILERDSEDVLESIAKGRCARLEDVGWCCRAVKGRGGLGTVKITGVRREEQSTFGLPWLEFQGVGWMVGGGVASFASWMVNPLVFWTAKDVWEFHRCECLAYCKLYDEGFERVGCVGCPMVGRDCTRRAFGRWPEIEKGWAQAFEGLWKRKRGTKVASGRYKGAEWPGVPRIEGWGELWEWWVEEAGSRGVGGGRELGLW